MSDFSSLKSSKFTLFFNFLALVLQSSQFTIHTGSACFPKAFKAQHFNVSSKSNIPLESDGHKCGEDDFLIAANGDIKFLAVVDGVGSWKYDNVTVRHFVTEFMEVLKGKFHALSHSTLRSHDNDENFHYELINESLLFLERAPQKAELNRGSCTIASVSINMRTLHMSSFLLGDAGFLIIRNSRVIFRSQDMLKSWNSPYQIGIGDGNRDVVDHPMFGSERRFKLQFNDVIVLGSDGLFDNLFDDHILSTVKWFTKRKFIAPWTQRTYTQIARKIAKHLTVDAKKVGEEVQRLIWSPFSKEILDTFGAEVYGGKNDDTTVVVAIVAYD